MGGEVVARITSDHKFMPVVDAAAALRRSVNRVAVVNRREIPRCDRIAAALANFMLFKRRTELCCMRCGECAIEPEHLRRRPVVRFSMGTKQARASGNRRVICCDQSGISETWDSLGRRKTQRRNNAQSSATCTAMRRTKALSAIFYEQNVLLVTEFAKSVRIQPISIEAHHDHCTQSGAREHCAYRIKVDMAVFIDIGKYGRGSNMEKACSGCDVRDCRHDHRIPIVNSRRGECNSKRVGATRNGDCVLSTRHNSNLSFKLFDEWPTNNLSTRNGFLPRTQISLTKLCKIAIECKKLDFRLRHKTLPVHVPACNWAHSPAGCAPCRCPMFLGADRADRARPSRCQIPARSAADASQPQ